MGIASAATRFTERRAQSHCQPESGWQYGFVNSPGLIVGRTATCRGFSLIEMLITLALILIMSVMLYGFGSRSHQQKQKLACQKNLGNIYLALDIYSKENGGTLPVIPGATSSEAPLSQLVPRYTVASEIFICPGSKDSALPNGEPFADRRISYAYWMGRSLGGAKDLLMSDRLVNTQLKQAGDPVFSPNGKPPGNNHHKYGGNFLFADGHSESSGTNASVAMVWPANVTLLNPKP
jgi:prepilin-type N-terminal cleavage/methylation domain-containing protein/prepilin-type processing-associated H-X9-DG protein